ncbi:unnamed protein product, partial [Phaeothamnion confervicola]
MKSHSTDLRKSFAGGVLNLPFTSQLVSLNGRRSERFPVKDFTLSGRVSSRGQALASDDYGQPQCWRLRMDCFSSGRRSGDNLLRYRGKQHGKLLRAFRRLQGADVPPSFGTRGSVYVVCRRLPQRVGLRHADGGRRQVRLLRGRPRRIYVRPELR